MTDGQRLRPKLLIATNNPGKLREYRVLLAGIAYDVVSLADAGIATVVAETGATFGENARLKAETIARESGLLTLADDSGLEVDALGGEPGVMSARYAGENASDSDRVKYLLAKLKDVPPEERTARFCCVIGIARPDGHTELFSGEVAGFIALEPRGNFGFGYDPVFYMPEMGRTMAELPEDVKNRISHRGRAAAMARDALLKMAEKG